MSKSLTRPSSRQTHRLKHSASVDDLVVHDHVCGLCDTRDEQYEIACRFIKTGLARQEQCFYVAERITPIEFLALLKAQGVDTEKVIASRSLQVLSGEELRSKLGEFTPNAMFSFLASTGQEAMREGFLAVRWAAEMTWLKKDNIPLVDFFSFESALNHFLREHNIVALCQYSKEDFRAELLIAAAETHPLFCYKEFVCRNHYYIPPEEFLKPTFLDMKWERMIGNIVSRERLLQEFLSTEGGARATHSAS